MGNSLKNRTARILLLAILLVVATSCAKLEKVRLRFDENSKGELTFTARLNLKEKFPPELFAAIQNCGFVARQSERADFTIIDAIYEFSNSAVMGANLDCLPTDWSYREVKFAKVTGLLQHTYQTTIWLEQDAVVQPASSVVQRFFPPKSEEEATERAKYIFDEPFFPYELNVEVPGQIVSIENQSKLSFFEIVSNYTLNQAKLNLIFNKTTDEIKAVFDPIVETLNEGNEVTIPLERYKIVVTSKENRFEVSTLTAVVGALFGSGALAQLIIWLIARRRRQGKTTT